MKIDIDEVKKGGYTLEEVMALIKLETNRIGHEFPYSSTRDEDYISLYKRGLIDTTTNGHVTTKEGQKVIGKLLGKDKKPKIDKSEYNFDDFWATFPSNDAHGSWRRTRALKSNKSGCEVAYNRAIGNGTSHADLIKALKWEVADRKSKSLSTNKMSYMKNSATWLNQREFEIILEELKNKGVNPEEHEDDWITEMI